MELTIQIVNYLILAYFVLLNTGYLVTSVLAYKSLRTYARRLKSLHVREMISAVSAPPITLLLPSFNEEAGCVESTRSVLSLQYPNYEVLVINDGSSDRTLARLIAAFELAPAQRYPTSELPTAAVRGIYKSAIHPNLWVVDKENGGKADALNTGINFCRTPLFCAMDADSLLEREALVRVARPFLEDESVIAVGGIIRLVNGCPVEAGRVAHVNLSKRLIVRFQVLEYLRAFLFGRVGWDALNVMLIISGAFGLFKRSVVVAAGGYATDTVGEDMELVVRLHRYALDHKMRYRITFIADPVAWTEAPESLRVLARQRDRWQRGLTQVLIRHQKMLLNPRYGRIGMLAYPYFYFLEMLGPAVESFGYVIVGSCFLLGLVPWQFAVAFLLVALVFGVALSLSAVALEEFSFRRYERFSDLARLFLIAILENFGYRQLTTWWRIKGLYSYLRGVQGWGKMERTGFQASPAAQALGG